MRRHAEFAKRHHRAVILMMALTIVVWKCLPVEAQATTLTGLVKNASGQPVAGALVKVRNAEMGLTFMVVSQIQGQYSTPNLLPGKYTVQGFGGDYQSAPAGPVEISRGQPGKMDLILSAPRKITPREPRMTDIDYAKLIPEGEGKRLLTTRCVNCHGLERILPGHKTRDDWLKTVDQMNFYRGDLTNQTGGPLTEQQRDVLVDYLAQHAGSDVPPLRRPAGSSSAPDLNRHLPATLLQGAEANYGAMEFDLRQVGGVHEIALDSQGIVWVSEERGDKLGRFDSKSFTHTRIDLPPAKSTERNPGAIWVDAQDRVWLSDGSPNSQIFQYNPKTKEFKTYHVPIPPRMEGAINSIRIHPDGTVWGTGISSSRLVKLDPVSGKFSDYPVPRGWHPYGLAIGGDKNVWYVASYGNAIGRLDVNTGKLTHYKLPTPRSDPRRMAADGEGNLWVAVHEKGKLAKVDYRTGQMTEYTPPTKDPGPHTVWVDTKRNLVWFGERIADKIAQFDPQTNDFLEFPVPSADSDVRRVQVDPTNPNRVWGEARSGRIVFIEVTR